MNPLAEFFASNVDYTSGFEESTPGDSQNGRTLSDSQNKSSSTPRSGQRVCDRCIVKKVKCDMKLPACSRCLESDSACVYSVKKRKPGPVKGSKHAKRRTSKDTSHRTSVSDASSPGSHRGSDARGSQVGPWPLEQPFQTSALSTPPTSLSPQDAQLSSLFGQSSSGPVLPLNIPSPLGIPPSQDQQRTLLDNFFAHIHPSIPLFHQRRLLARYEAGTLCQHLLLAICVVTAKILGLDGVWDGSTLEDCTVYLLELKVIESESTGRALTLDNFRQACLLAFYAFHQHPAYQCGLHQIDFHAAGSQFDRESVSPEDLDEWRYVWWSIYCLDCYSNVTAITPFVIEVESIKTALPNTSLTGPDDDMPASTTSKYLPDDTDMLWKTAKEVTNSLGEVNFNMHILTTTLIREAATIHRLRKQSTSRKLKTRSADLEDHFCAFRLALPARYLSVARNTLGNESSSEHNARLICVCHIYLARMLTYFPYDPEENEADWYTRWQQCLESAQDIVSVVKQWDSQYFTATDPAICFLVSFAASILHLHGCAADASLEFKVRMDTQKDVLVLFLEQFASVWSLPRFLIMSFEQFKKMVSGPLKPVEMDRILKVAVGPINYRWFNFMSLSANLETLESPGRVYENLFSQEWDSNDWETLMPVAQV